MARRQLKKPEGQEQQWRTSAKRMRGEGVFYDEAKSEIIQASLTPTAKTKLKELAKQNKLSVSEYLERWLRGFDQLILPQSSGTNRNA
jgi:DNA-binding TFAR19-related protein (PDSD5 family)